MSLDHIAIIGGGNLGAAIARGFVNKGFDRQKLIIVQRNPLKRIVLQAEGFNVYERIDDCSSISAVIVTVKPKDVVGVIQELQQKVPPTTIIVSAISGVNSELLINWLGDSWPLVRMKFSVLIEVAQELIPTWLCNIKAEQAFKTIKKLFEPLGDLYIMRDEFMMEASGWELSTIPGILTTKILKERLDEASEGEKRLTERLLLSGFSNLLGYLLEKYTQGNSLSDTLDELCAKIATPGGVNEAVISFLQERQFWQLPSQGRDIFVNRMAEINAKMPISSTPTNS